MAAEKTLVGGGMLNGFKTVPEVMPVSISPENIAPYTLPAEAFSFVPVGDAVCCHFKNGDKERKIYSNIEISDVEKEQLTKLQQEVKATGMEVSPTIATMATRFLSRARGDVHKAIKLMKDTQEWRSQYFKGGPLSDKELAEDLKHGIIYFSGRDKAFRPVIVVRGNRIPEKWIKEKRTDLLIRVLVFCMEYLIRYMLVPGKVENLDVIFDFKGVSIGMSDVSRLKEIYSVMSHHYLGRVFKFYICNLSPGLKMLTSMVTALLTDRQKQKLCFLDSVSELQRDFALHQLEEDLGGSRPIEKNFYPFPLPAGPFAPGSDRGPDAASSISGGHAMLTDLGVRGKLWDEKLSREENLSLDFAEGAFETFMKNDLPIPPECVKTRTLQAWYNIFVVAGVKAKRSHLSTAPDGSRIDIWSEDDDSGRQRWVLQKEDGDWYTIRILDGVSGEGRYLSAQESGSALCLAESDDGSGRQRWLLNKSEGVDWYTIQVVGGVSDNATFLSAHEDGSLVDLWECDDDSGRQRWTLTPLGACGGNAVCTEAKALKEVDDYNEEVIAI